MGGNYLGDLGVISLAGALAALPALQLLDLKENYNIGEGNKCALLFVFNFVRL